MELEIGNSLRKQQSRQRYAANGFAFVPQTCRVLDSIRLVVELLVNDMRLTFASAFSGAQSD